MKKKQLFLKKKQNIWVKSKDIIIDKTKNTEKNRFFFQKNMIFCRRPAYRKIEKNARSEAESMFSA